MSRAAAPTPTAAPYIVLVCRGNAQPPLITLHLLDRKLAMELRRSRRWVPAAPREGEAS